jgi:hypothetical protein
VVKREQFGAKSIQKNPALKWGAVPSYANRVSHPLLYNDSYTINDSIMIVIV